MVNKKEKYSQKGFIDLASLGIVLLVISALALPAWLKLKGTRVTTQQKAAEEMPKAGNRMSVASGDDCIMHCGGYPHAVCDEDEDILVGQYHCLEYIDGKYCVYDFIKDPEGSSCSESSESCVCYDDWPCDASDLPSQCSCCSGPTLTPTATSTPVTLPSPTLTLTPTQTQTPTPTPTALATLTPTLTMTPTATPTMSASTYTINSSVVCPTGKTLTGQVRNFYAFWPLPAPTPAEVLDWQYGPYSVGPHSTTLTAPEGGHYTMGIYFGMETKGEVALQPIGSPPHPEIEYAEHFSPQTWMAHWKRFRSAVEGVPAGTYEIVFQGNDEICSVSTTSPTPTPTPPCSVHAPPNPCPGSVLCAVSQCWDTDKDSSNWAVCQQYDFDGNCRIDVVDVQKCSLKCKTDGSLGTCCGPSTPCGSGMQCNLCYQDSVGECVSGNPTVTPTPTEAPCECPAGKPPKSMGNANCDAVVDGQDFETWREEFRQIVQTKTADFNCDDKVDGPDYEIWRSNRWITAIINQFAQEEEVSVNEVTVKSVLPKTWTDTCLECISTIPLP